MKKKIQSTNIGTVLKLVVKEHFQNFSEATKAFGFNSEQALRNFLARASNDKISFQSLTKILENNNYNIIYTLTQSVDLENEFNQEQFENLLSIRQLKKAGRLLESSKLEDDEKIELQNRITEVSTLTPNTCRVLLDLEEESVKRLFEMEQPLSLSQKANNLIKRNFLDENIYSTIIDSLEGKNKKTDLSNCIYSLQEWRKKTHIFKVHPRKEVIKYVVLDEKIFVLLKGIEEKMYNVSHLFKATSLRELKYIKNQKDFIIKAIWLANQKPFQIEAFYKGQLVEGDSESKRVDLKSI